MARLEAQAKLLYYPTPEIVIRQIATWFEHSDREEVRLVDPCSGKGDALKLFAELTGTKQELIGIELSYSRAEEAAKVFHKLLQTSFYRMRSNASWSDRSVSLVFNNPPYDWSEFEEVVFGGKRHIRHEVLFVTDVTCKLVPGGHQVIIIPRSILGDKMMLGEKTDTIAKHLHGWYENVQVMRFPDGEYERFKQVVVFALNKRDKYQPPTKEKVDAIVSLANPEAEIAVLTNGEGNIPIPLAPLAMKFIYTPADPEDQARLARKTSPIGSIEYFRATYVRPLGAPFHPATPLNLGHMSMLITGQETGNIVLQRKDD